MRFALPTRLFAPCVSPFAKNVHGTSAANANYSREEITAAAARVGFDLPEDAWPDAAAGPNP